jgi:hypothetical protein
MHVAEPLHQTRIAPEEPAVGAGNNDGTMMTSVADRSSMEHSLLMGSPLANSSGPVAWPTIRAWNGGGAAGTLSTTHNALKEFTRS